MKALWIFLFIIISITVTAPVNAQQEMGPADVVGEYLLACQEGDLDEIKKLITGPYYNKRKSLLNENAGYANFLVSHFIGVKFFIISETMNSLGQEVVVVERQYPDGTFLRTKFIVVAGQNKKTWKIYDEQLLDD